MTSGEKIEDLKFILPGPKKLPPGIVLPFPWVRVRGDRVYASGHTALNPDGSISEIVGREVTIEQGYEAARQTGLPMLANLKRELGPLNHVTAWLRVFGMVNIEA